MYCMGLRFEWMLILWRDPRNIRKISCIFVFLFKMLTFARKLARSRVLRINFQKNQKRQTFVLKIQIAVEKKLWARKII